MLCNIADIVLGAVKLIAVIIAVKTTAYDRKQN